MAINEPVTDPQFRPNSDEHRDVVDRAEAVLLDGAMAPIVEVVVRAIDDGYEAASVDGRVRFRRRDVGSGWAFDAATGESYDEVAGRVGAWLADRIGDFNGGAGHGPIRIETDLWSETYGDGEPVTTLRVVAFELMRGSTGRRSLRQLDTWDWTGAARPELVVMPIFLPRTDDFTG